MPAMLPSRPPEASAGAGRAWERLLFALLLVLHLLPLWCFPRFPSQDGPSHQGVAAILRQMDGRQPLPAGSRLEEVFARNSGGGGLASLPNLFTFWLLEKGFGFASVATAERLLLTLYVLLLPLALRYAVGGIDGRSLHLSWLAFPFVYNFLFHMGFYNFCFSLAAFLVALGYYLRARSGERGMGTRQILVLLGLVVWVYLCHPVTLVVTAAVLGTLALWQVVLALRPSGGGASATLPGAVQRHLLPVLAATLPPLVLLLSFAAARAGSKIEGLPLAVRVKHLVGLYTLASLDRRTAYLAAGTALLIAVLAVAALRARLGRRGLEVRDGWLAAVGVVLLAYFLAPSQMSGGGFIVHRLNLFPFLILILWLAGAEPTRRLRLLSQAGAALLAVAFLALFVRSYARLGRGLEEIAEVGTRIEPGKTLLYLSYAHQGVDGEGRAIAFRTQPFVHAGSAVAAARGAVDLALYEANEDYFPVVYRPERNPYTHLATAPLGIETEPPQVDLAAYRRTTGIPIDYVLLWGWRDERLGEPAVTRVAEQLGAGFSEVARSRAGGARLYRRTDLEGIR